MEKLFRNTGGFGCVTGASLVGVGLGWAILYLSMRRFHWTPNKKEVESKRRLFSPRHILDAFKTVLRPREDSKRLYVWLMMFTICMILSPFIGIGAVEYLYVRTRYGWEVDEYSIFQSYDSTIGIIGKLIVHQESRFANNRTSPLSQPFFRRNCLHPLICCFGNS